MKIAVIGGGITGLTAAYLLAKKNHQLAVFEKEPKLGGLVSSFKEENWSWSLERFYHHFFSSDKEVLGLLEKLEIKNKLFFKTPKTSVFVDNQIFPFDSLQTILAFPKLTIGDKIRTFLVAGFMKMNPFWKPLERATAYCFIKKTMGNRNFNLIWKPLLDSKFGEFSPQIPASWYWTRIKKRSFKLGYLEGGIETLTQALSEQLQKAGGKIFTNNLVGEVHRVGNQFEIFTNQKRFPEKFDKIIATVSPESLKIIFNDLLVPEKEKLQSLKSLGAIVLVLELKKSFLTDGTYWLNINDPTFPFVAVVEHTNFIDKKYYDDHHLLYIGGYYPAIHPFFKMTKEQILKEFQPFLEKINPNFDFSLFTVSCFLFKDPYAQPIPSVNYSQHSLPSINTSIPNLYWGSLHHVYPQDRGVNYAIKLGREIYEKILGEGGR